MLVAVAVMVGAWMTFAPPGNVDLSRALSRRGRVVMVGVDPQALEVEGSALLPVSGQVGVGAAMAGKEPEALRRAMTLGGIDSVLVSRQTALDAGNGTLTQRLGSYDHVPGFRGLHLAPGFALYEADFTHELGRAEREALAGVARGLLRGVRRPRITSFPKPLRAVRHVEIMVMLRRAGRPRLWRSARGSSIARALITAAEVARRRWIERERAMGGPIDEALPSLDVEVALLQDDGVVGDRAPAFVNSVFGEVHGVAYERKGAWRYLLPDATAREGGGEASRAYEALFKSNGLPSDSLARPEVGLYRLVVNVLATSPAYKKSAKPKKDGLAEVARPEEVLGP